MEEFINNFEPKGGDHIEPYAHHTCSVCDGAIDPMVTPNQSILWKHVFSTPYDHIPEPIDGTFDMFPPAAVTLAVHWGVQHYQGKL